MDVRIPEPGRTILTGQVKAGQALVGQTIPADTYVDQPLLLVNDSATLSAGVTLVSDDQPLVLPDGTAEVLVTAPVDQTVTVEVTGYLDLLGGETVVYVENNETVVVEGTGLLELDAAPGTDVFWQRNITIPEPFSGDAICGQVICGVPPVLCGQNLKGDHYLDYTLDLDGGAVTLTIEVKLTLADSAALELDGGPVHVNPVLMPFECLNLDLEAITCTDLDLATVVCEDLALTALAAEPLDLVASICEPLDLEPLVPLEA